MSYFEDVKAWDDTTGVSADRELRIRVMREEWFELCDAIQDRDRAEIAKEAADLIWTVLGLCNHEAIPFDAVWAEVSRSNWAKLVDGDVLRRSDGKIIKPPGWIPPDIAGVLRRRQRELLRRMSSPSTGHPDPHAHGGAIDG